MKSALAGPVDRPAGAVVMAMLTERVQIRLVALEDRHSAPENAYVAAAVCIVGNDVQATPSGLVTTLEQPCVVPSSVLPDETM
jgi:hypothetical protein